MARRLRPYIGEGEGKLIFIETLAGNLAAQDAGKNIVVVISRHVPPFRLR
jgi:hypothetical protein